MKNKKNLIIISLFFSLVLSSFIFLNATSPQVVGNIDGLRFVNGKVYLSGWACDQGYNDPIEVEIFVGGAGEEKLSLASGKANRTSSLKIKKICNNSSSKSRFLLPLNLAQIKKYAGKSIYVYGRSFRGSSFDRLLTNSGNHMLFAPFLGKIAIGIQPWYCLMEFFRTGFGGDDGTIREIVGWQNQLSYNPGRNDSYNWQKINKNDRFGTMAPLYFNSATGSYNKGFCNKDFLDAEQFELELEMFAHAGVDIIIVDSTNNSRRSGFTFDEVNNYRDENDIFRRTHYNSTEQRNIRATNVERGRPYRRVEKPFVEMLKAWTSLKNKRPKLKLPKFIPWVPVGDYKKDVLMANFFKEAYLKYPNAFDKDKSGKPRFLMKDDKIEKPKISKNGMSTQKGYEFITSSETWGDIYLMWANDLSWHDNGVLDDSISLKNSHARWSHTQVGISSENNMLNNLQSATQVNLISSLNSQVPKNFLYRKSGLTLLSQFKKVQDLLIDHPEVRDMALWSWNYSSDIPARCSSNQIEDCRENPSLFELKDEFDLESSRSLQPNVYTGHFYYALLASAIKQIKAGADLNYFYTQVKNSSPLSPNGKLSKTYVQNGQFYAEGWACLRGSEQPAILEFSVDNSGEDTIIIPRRHFKKSEVVRLTSSSPSWKEAVKYCSVPGLINTSFNARKLWGFKVKLPIGNGLGGKKIKVKIIQPYHRLQESYNKVSNLNMNSYEETVKDSVILQSNLFPLPGRICGKDKAACVCKPNKVYSNKKTTKTCSNDGMSWL